MSWDVIEDKPISGAAEGIHEFARPWVLWDRCYKLAPNESQRFALGLWAHQIADHQSGGFDRHALYFQHGPADGKDFPRHAGFYILTWAHAHHYSQEPVFLQAIETLLARFERKRVQKDGTMIGTIGPLDCESAAMLVPEPLAAGAPPLWKTGYSAGTQASTAMFYLARYEQVHKREYRDALIAIADKYRNSVPEEDLDAWPLAFAHAISSQVAAYRLTDDAKYRDDAQRLARLAVKLFWQDNPLPRASMKTGHYEAITGADSLALALLQVHATLNNLSVEVPQNTIDR
jgi:hypothetical protein